MKLSPQLEHAIKYCQFKLENSGNKNDEVIIATSQYYATGEPFINSVIVFHTSLNHPILEPIPELYGLDSDAFEAFSFAYEKIKSSRFLIESDGIPYLYKIVDDEICKEFKEDSYFIRPDIIMNLSYLLSHEEDQYVQQIKYIIPTSVIKNIDKDWGYFKYKSLFAVNYS